MNISITFQIFLYISSFASPESMLWQKAEMVIYDAANAIVALKKTSVRDLTPVVSVLQLFLGSSKPTLRYSGGSV